MWPRRICEKLNFMFVSRNLKFNVLQTAHARMSTLHANYTVKRAQAGSQHCTTSAVKCDDGLQCRVETHSSLRLPCKQTTKFSVAVFILQAQKLVDRFSSSTVFMHCRLVYTSTISTMHAPFGIYSLFVNAVKSSQLSQCKYWPLIEL